MGFIINEASISVWVIIHFNQKDYEFNNQIRHKLLGFLQCWPIIFILTTYSQLINNVQALVEQYFTGIKFLKNSLQFDCKQI